MIPQRYDLSIPANQAKLEAADALGRLADEAGIPLMHMALAFVIRHPAVTAAIIGPRTIEQLESQLGAADLQLDDALLDRIDEIVAPGTTINPTDAGWTNPALEPRPAQVSRGGALKRFPGGPMTELQRYLAEEVAEDLADGIITRREAMRRLGLLGVGAAAATGLLSATAGKALARRSEGTGDGGRGTSGSVDEWAPVATAAITFPGPNGTLMGAWAPADGARRAKGSVLVMHENRGLNDHIRNVAGRFAASGYSALALDLLSEEGGTASFPGEAEVAAALAAVAPARLDDDMKAAVGELVRRAPRQPVNAIGFCFGGGMIWRLLAAGERRLLAAAPFYGPFPEGGDLRRTRAAVLGVYGGLDERVNATRDVARAALEAAHLKHEILTFGEANHAFFNDTGPRFGAPAAEEAWSRVLGWFGRGRDG